MSLPTRSLQYRCRRLFDHSLKKTDFESVQRSQSQPSRLAQVPTPPLPPDPPPLYEEVLVQYMHIWLQFSFLFINTWANRQSNIVKGSKAELLFQVVDGLPSNDKREPRKSSTVSSQSEVRSTSDKIILTISVLESPSHHHDHHDHQVPPPLYWDLYPTTLSPDSSLLCVLPASPGPGSPQVEWEGGCLKYKYKRNYKNKYHYCRLRDQEEAADVQASLWKSYHHPRPPHTHTRTKGESESEQMKYHRFAVFYVRQTQ